MCFQLRSKDIAYLIIQLQDNSVDVKFSRRDQSIIVIVIAAAAAAGAAAAGSCMG